MSATTALIVRDDSNLTASFTEAANKLKQEALEAAALIGKVSNADEQALAVNAQRALTEILNTAEKARKACKEPVLEFGRRIDLTAKTFVSDLMDEQTRIAALIGSFQTLELAKARAAEAAENQRLSDLERERQKEAAQAQSHEQLEAVHEKFDTRARDESVAVAPARVQGQIVKEGWDYQLQDQLAFARWAISSGNTGCIKIEPVASEIKALLKTGVQIPGIKAWPTVSASVRARQATNSISV